MKRRQLASRTLAGAALAASLPLVARAEMGDREKNIIFTAEDPAHWAGVEALHIPQISVSGSTITVTTPHPMSQAHYIVSHTIVLKDGKFLDRKTFNYTDQPVSLHTLPDGYKGWITVTSTCNLHDFWAKKFSV
jgi:superoxide reductase